MVNAADSVRVGVSDATFGDLDRGAIRSWVVDAARAGALQPWVQPIFDAHGVQASCEVLARCPFPDGTLRSPDQFADALGVSEDWRHVDAAMLAEAAILALRHRELSAEIGRVAWNSASSTLRDDYLHLVHETLAVSGLRGEELCLELTEHIPLRTDGQIAVLKELRRLGVRLALDDIGESPSLLRALRVVGFDVVKLDRPLVAELATERGTTFIANLIRMAHDLGAEVVAEGIESEEHRDRLAQLGCDLFQANMLAVAVPVAQYLEQFSRPVLSAAPR